MVEGCLVESEMAKPVAVPLALPDGFQGIARQLPGGRGWLRVVKPGEVLGAPR